MKIEQKFRVWDNENNCMINYNEDNTLFIPCNLGVLYLDSGIRQNRYSILDFPVMQFTGLTDMNGDNSKEVYGGDILYNSDRKEYQEVLYNEEKARWDVRYSHGEQRSLADAIGNLNIVAGNKFENPELL